jgi:hypothetical protein
MLTSAGLVLLGDTGRDPADIADGDALRFGPGADGTAVLPGLRSAGRMARAARAGRAGVLDEWRELIPEGIGVRAAEVDLIVDAIKAESDRFVGGAGVDVIFEPDGYFPSHVRPPELATRQGGSHPAIVTCADSSGELT